MTTRNRSRSFARRTVGSPRGGRVANMKWIGTASNNSLSIAVGAQTILEVTNPTADHYSNATIRRILGSLTFNTEFANVNIFFRAGLIVMDGDALSAGAPPDPWADETNWLWEKSGWFRTDVVNSPGSEMRLEVDVRVGRKLPQARASLVLVMENLAGSGNALTWFEVLKVLIRQP